MPVQIGRKLCTHPACPKYQPCPDHGVSAWETSNRRASTVSGWEQQRRAKRVLFRDDTICHVCKRPGATVVDHVIPVEEGGADDESNLAPIHQEPCHRLKTQAEAERGRARKQGG
jgi:5-methylcytosine-specific restriction enzyme A